MAVLRELNLDNFAAFLSREADKLASLDFSRPLKVCALLVKSDVRENFQGSHTPDGKPWKSLKRPRSGKRHKGKGPAKPLLDTGLLAASMSANGQGHIEEITSHTLTVGSNLHYAAYQNDGTRTIPSREFAGFSSEVITDIDEVLLEFVEENLF